MHLRKQLLFVSIFTLSLPWVGCQYIGEVENTLHEGQNQSLRTTLNILRSHFERDAKLTTELERFGNYENDILLHFHPFSRPMRLDGYREEWTHLEAEPQTLSNDSEAKVAQIYAAEHNDKAWLFIEVPFAPKRYFRPGQSYDNVDQIRLALHTPNPSRANGDAYTKQFFRIVTSSPGVARVFDESQGSSSTEYRIRAHWSESPAGYQVELSMPVSWANQALGLEIRSEGHIRYSNAHQPDKAPPTTRVLKDIQERLSDFELVGTRAELAAQNGAYLGAIGSLNFQEKRQPPWFMQWIFDAALSNQIQEQMPNNAALGHARNSPGFSRAISDEDAPQRYIFKDHEVTSLSTALHANGKIVGVLTATQNISSLSTFTDAAFNKLLMYSILLTLCAAAALTAYASWLSYRILQLRKSTHEAISDRGNVTQDFQASTINDEIGDLSRSFADLLRRIQEYTEYLRTLSSKLGHELRTPLAIVGSSLDNMEQEKDPAKMTTYIERAKGGSERLSQILAAMSSAGRVEHAIAAAELEILNLDNMLQELHGAYTDAYPQAQFSYQSAPEAADAKILASDELLVQMLDKLIDNAVDYCLTGGTIDIALHIDDSRADDSQAIVSIANPGPHLPEAMRTQIFDSLVSIRENSDGKHHLGFGLYIAQLIAQSHQGVIRADNLLYSEGHAYNGVVFKLHIPLCDVPDPVARKEPNA